MKHENICYEVDEIEKDYFPITPPIVMTSSFKFKTFEEYVEASNDEFNHYVYTRGANPTNTLLEKKLAKLEYGEKAKLFGSGMGAISATLFSLLKQDDHIIIINTVYSTTLSFVKKLENYGVKYTVVETNDIMEVKKAIKSETKVVYIESPSTQKFAMINLEKVAKLCKEKGIISVIDNTWATPIFQNPLPLGIDVVIHSLSKYIGGHSDIVGGVVIGSKEIIHTIEKEGYLFLGSTMSPMNSFLVLRGLRTLPLRMKQHNQNVIDVIDYLKKDERIESIYHPYNNTDNDYKYLKGYGSLLAITLKEKSVYKLKCFINNINAFTLGVSWGGYESMILPVYREYNVEQIKERGLDITHIRLFVGLEDSEYLIKCINDALNIAY